MAPIHSRPLLASSCQRRLLLAAAILLCSSHANAVIAAEESSSWCSSSFEGEPQQQINDRFEEITVRWLRDTNQTALYGGCGQLPRATWNIEPAPDGVNSTQIWMSPPHLGRGIVDSVELWGIMVNETFIDNNAMEEIGVRIQVPKDQLTNVNINSPLRVNIAPGFTNLTSLIVYIGSSQDAGNHPGNNYTCGKKNPVLIVGEELSLAGLGAEVRADLSTVEGDISLTAVGAGNDIAVKLPEEGYPLTPMSLAGRDSRYYIQGSVNCTDPYGEGFKRCHFTGGSADLCKEDCFSQLVIDGDIEGNVTVSSFYRQEHIQEPDVVSVAKVSASGGCDQFVPENPAIFDCSDGAAANATVEVEPLSCTMQEEGMNLSDVVKCPTHYSDNGFDGSFCDCYVPTSETCPEPSSAVFGALLSKTVSFGFTGMLCYALSMLY